MASQESGFGAKRVFAVVVVALIVVVGVVSFAALPWFRVASSAASTTSMEQTPTFYSTTSPLGLRLQVQLNTSTFETGSGLAAQIVVYNSFDENLSLIPAYQANSTILSWNDYDFFCGDSGYPLRTVVGYALFSGDYSADNFSLVGNPLQLAPPVGVSCVSVAGPDSIVFLPESDNASLSGLGYPEGNHQPVALAASTESCETPSPGTYYCGGGKGLSGYWNTTGVNYLQDQEAAIGSQYFSYFPSGEYTLAVQDTWGQNLYAHFQVTPRVSAASSSSTSSISIDSALVAKCPQMGPGIGFGTVTAGTASPALLCIQLYYYSDTALTINLTNALSVQALQYVFDNNNGVALPRTFSGAPNFTLSASQSELIIGGPNNENEGAVIAYSVTAVTGASGTYPLGLFLAKGLSAWMFGSQGPQSCGSYGQLVAGNGAPNYNQGISGGCITYAIGNESSSSSSEFAVPGVPYQLIKGDLYFAVSGVGSPTG
jgi:hypothetical protein